MSVAEACTVLDALADLHRLLADADPEVKRTLYEAFRLNLNIDRNTGLITMKALCSSAFCEVKNLDNLKVTHKAIAGGRFAPISNPAAVANGTIAGAGFESNPPTPRASSYHVGETRHLA